MPAYLVSAKKRREVRRCGYTVHKPRGETHYYINGVKTDATTLDGAYQAATEMILLKMVSSPPPPLPTPAIKKDKPPFQESLTGFQYRTYKGSELSLPYRPDNYDPVTDANKEFAILRWQRIAFPIEQLNEKIIELQIKAKGSFKMPVAMKRFIKRNGYRVIARYSIERKGIEIANNARTLGEAYNVALDMLNKELDAKASAPLAADAPPANPPSTPLASAPR